MVHEDVKEGHPIEPSHPVLEVRNVTKAFPGVVALESVDLWVNRGEVVALVGENGAGKSTLMKILMGIYQPDAGEILTEGELVRFTSPNEALLRGVAMIHQELSPVLDMTIAENLYLGREPRRSALPIVDAQAMERQAGEDLARMGLALSPRRMMRSLSVSQMQLVEITKAVSYGARVIIMDEPTSALTLGEAQLLFDQVRNLRDEGVSIIYISHKMEEIFDLADRIVVLRDGRVVQEARTESVSRAELLEAMVDRPIEDVYPDLPEPSDEVLLEVRNLTNEPLFRDVSFQLRRGEVLGLAGLVGAGRSEVVETLFGIRSADSGEILVRGQQAALRHPKDAVAQGLALVTEDRKLSGLVMTGTIKENAALVTLANYARAGVLSARQEQSAVDVYFQRLRIKAPSQNTNVENLSGGNQQKVILAKWLLADPEVIIFDEPTRGIDIGAKMEIYRLIAELAAKGKAILLISSEMIEVVGMSHRVIVMRLGEVNGELGGADVTQKNIMALAAH